jgi:hypothetical protein
MLQLSQHDSGAVAIPDVNVTRHILYRTTVPFSFEPALGIEVVPVTFGRDRGTSCGSESSFQSSLYLLHFRDHFFTKSGIDASRMINTGIVHEGITYKGDQGNRKGSRE